MSRETSATLDSPCRQLFLGEVPSEVVYPYPKQDPEEAETTDMAVRAFREWAADNLDPALIDREQNIPESVREGIAELGLMGMTVPEEYGGYGFGATAYCRVVEEVTRHDASLAVYIGAHLSIGARPLILDGTPEQRAKYLPKVATGETVCAFALTEPGAGSDAGSLRSRAVWDPEAGQFRLNGNKIWISNGGYAGLFTVFARAEGGPAAEAGTAGVTAFLLERGARGFTNGPPEHKLGIRGTCTVELAFQDTPLHAEQVIGGFGNGFGLALASLLTGRLSLGACCTGAAKAMIALAVDHARERKQFRRPIIEFGMIREKLGRMAAHAYASESMAYLTAGLYDQHRIDDLSVEAGYCKVLGSEVGWTAVNDAVQILGGIGYMTEYPYERHLRDSRINLIFEGTNEILRLSGTLDALKEPGRRASEQLKAAKAELGAAGIAAALGADSRPTAAPRWIAEPLREQGEALAAATAAFGGKVQEVVRKHRRAILGQQYTLRRLADAAIQLYAMTAGLSRASSRIAERGAESAAREILLTRRFVEESCRAVRGQLEAIETRQDGWDEQIADLLREEGHYPTPLF
ncbi:MAG: acyl-CoA dehydrogenase family protein [Acidobacteria bacterium]|nr:acyl-CoA dehydrogenase family protein [Acidobacteriota bacterium]